MTRTTRLIAFLLFWLALTFLTAMLLEMSLRQWWPALGSPG